MYINGAQSIELSGPGTISGGTTGNIDVNPGNTLVLSGSITGGGTLHKQTVANNTAGTLVLSGSNSGFSGTFYTDSNSGTTYFGNNAALGSGTLNVGAGGLDFYAGTPTTRGQRRPAECRDPQRRLRHPQRKRRQPELLGTRQPGRHGRRFTPTTPAPCPSRSAGWSRARGGSA